MSADDDAAAMQAVLSDMGNAARSFKQKKYAPKQEPVAEAAPAESEVAPEVSVADLEALISSGG